MVTAVDGTASTFGFDAMVTTTVVVCPIRIPVGSDVSFTTTP